MIDACEHLRATKQRVCATKAITPTIRASQRQESIGLRERALKGCGCL